MSAKTFDFNPAGTTHVISTKMVINLNEKTYFLITGASRGIGQTLALRVAEKLSDGSVVVLLARSQEGLTKTKSQIDALGKQLHVLSYVIDLSAATAEQFHDILAASSQLNGQQASSFERAFIIHNVGSVGDVSKRACELADTQMWTQYYHLNLFGVVALNCQFFNLFKGVPKLVVNISSKCGVEPFMSMGYYCSGKAARDMYFRVLAVEETDAIVLNYAPGAIDTDMSVQVQEITINEELAKAFKELRDSKTMLTPEQTTEKFLMVLQAHNFKSGDHVDYWD